MSKRIGYARVSTDDQNLDLQHGLVNTASDSTTELLISAPNTNLSAISTSVYHQVSKLVFQRPVEVRPVRQRAIFDYHKLGRLDSPKVCCVLNIEEDFYAC